jgi:hypothetical protein
VVTDVGGNSECLVPGVTGVLVSADPTPEQVADAALRVLNDPAFTERARVQGPPFVRRRFGLERMASEFLDLCFTDERPDRTEIGSCSVLQAESGGGRMGTRADRHARYS